ncbi:MAG: DSBA oxidoreductase [Parcubacteria group bacterium GW2011_GWA1_33_6]|nr:MAG: DSBA oxidoreductase [Parcubacteria group bacterium GW2011_GWA2_33_14]KKP54202.1 MAG: DSBA oxidoreductase [Parcubacteria group bacterium GW2011_GWA1_33_6]
MQNQMQPQPQPRSQHNEKYKLFLPLSIIVASIIISGTILYSDMNSSSNTVNNNNNQNNNQQVQGPVKVSVDNDAVLGDKNAPITMIEFSDYECPFCKRHFLQVYPDIKKDYIDTGKVKLVFRDFIAVDGHNPLATTEAMAAECAREQGGDQMYFKYHDEIFKKTTSNGNGLKLEDLTTIANSLSINSTQLQQCIDSNKYKEEILKDIADGSKAGVSGTPSFFIGESTSDGLIDGAMVVGAQPFDAFKVIIEEKLIKTMGK